MASGSLMPTVWKPPISIKKVYAVVKIKLFTLGEEVPDHTIKIKLPLYDTKQKILIENMRKMINNSEFSWNNGLYLVMKRDIGNPNPHTRGGNRNLQEVGKQFLSLEEFHHGISNMYLGKATIEFLTMFTI